MSSPIHLFILAGIAMLVFGGGRFSSTMADVAKGMKAFKKGMAEPGEDIDCHQLGTPDPASEIKRTRS